MTSLNKNQYKARIYAEMGLMFGLCTLSAYILHLKKINISFTIKYNFLLVLIAGIALIILFFFLANQCRKSCE